MITGTPLSAARRAATVVGGVLRNRSLRRLELAFAGFNAAEWASWIAMLVYAYQRGGTTESAVVAAALLVPAMLFAPFGSVLADRHRPGRVLLGSYVAQTITVAVAAGVMLTGGPALFVYIVAGLASASVTVTRPTMSALTPTLARTPDELTAVNVVSSWVESISVFVAPAIAGVAMTVWSPGAVFCLCAAMTAASALFVLGEPGPPPAGSPDDRETVRSSLGGGFRLVRADRATRALVILLCADFVALGALDVLYPTLAVGVLDRDEGWAGYLNAAFGAGATVAVVLTASLVGRRRLMPAMLVGLVLYVASFLLLAAYPTVATSLLLLALAGAGRVVLDVGSRTLLQRTAPNDVLARVFGLLEGLAMAGLAVGSLLVGALAAIGGPELAIVGIGLLLPAAALGAGRTLLDVDRTANVPVVEIGLLRTLSMFAPLAPATLETVARSLERTTIRAGTEVIRQGDAGDRFFVIGDGRVEVVRDGVAVATLERGDGFGEIALLRDVPRTATCRTVDQTTLYALGKDAFLTALTGHPQSRTEADRLVAARGLSPGR